jgi:hypothetical protein
VDLLWRLQSQGVANVGEERAYERHRCARSEHQHCIDYTASVFNLRSEVGQARKNNERRNAV